MKCTRKTQRTSTNNTKKIASELECSFSSAPKAGRNASSICSSSSVLLLLTSSFLVITSFLSSLTLDQGIVVSKVLTGLIDWILLMILPALIKFIVCVKTNEVH